jgi:5'-nucleotidase
MIRPLIASLAALVLTACASVPAGPAAPSSDLAPLTVRIIGINDFHGNLLPQKRKSDAGPLTPDGRAIDAPVGGAAVLATAVRQLRAQNSDSLVISAGDLISASPLVSSLFLDEPSIGVMNRIGLDFNAVGNHELDRGWQELLRMQNGGCEQFGLREPCQVENPFEGADFPFLAANVTRPDGSLLLPAYGIRHFGSGEREVAVAVIGLPLQGVPALVSPTGIEGLNFGDEADAINALVPKLLDEGADAIIVAIHQGFEADGYYDSGDDCGGAIGPLNDILKRLDPRVDLVISGHTHRFYICEYSQFDPTRDFLVTSTGYGSGMVADLVVTIDPAKHDVRVKAAEMVIVQSEDPNFRRFAPDPEIAAYVAQYEQASRAAAERPVGRISGPAREDGWENALGNMIADAQLAATRANGAQIAFMNEGGVRTDLVPETADGTVTFAQIYAVQPFGNVLMTMDLTGAQIAAALEQQFTVPDAPEVLSVSDGFTYRLDRTKPVGQRVSDMRLDGTPIDPDARYRVTVNSFLAGGGDRFTVFAEPENKTIGPVDLDSFEAWIDGEGGRALPATDRITLIGG